MTLAGLLIWFMVWSQVGGWSGLGERLDAHQQGLASQMLELGHDRAAVEDVSGASREEIERKLLTGGEYDPAQGTITRSTPGWPWPSSSSALPTRWSTTPNRCRCSPRVPSGI